jgi:hypothetical protein
MAVKVTVETKGLFFKNPVGQLHMNIYDVLEEAAAIGADSARSQLRPGHGYLTGNLHDSIQPRFVNATRTTKFTGRARVIAGARGYELVRRYAGRIDRKYRYMANAAKAVRSWADSGAVRDMLHKDLS